MTIFKHSFLTYSLLAIFFTCCMPILSAENYNLAELQNTIKNKNLYEQLNILNSAADNCEDKTTLYYKSILDILKKIAISSKNPDAVALFYNNTGDYYYKINQNNKAMYFYSKALELKNKIKNQAIVATTYKNLGIIYSKNNKFEEAKNNYELALNLAKSINNQKTLADTYSSLSVLYMNRSEYDKAEDYARKGLEIRLTQNNKLDIVKSYATLGNILGQASDYNEALDFHFKALKTAETINDSTWIAGSLNNIGTIYNYLNESTKALEYYLKAAKLKEKINSVDATLSYTYNNLALIYKKLRNYDLSVEYLLKSIKLKKKNNDLLGIASSSNNISSTYTALGKFDLAEKYCNDALKIYTNTQNTSGIVSCYNNLGYLYMQKKDFKKGLNFSLKANELALETGNKQHSLRSYGLTVKIYEYMGDYKNAYLYHKKYFTYKDSIFNNDTEKQLAEIQTKYETEKKDKENTLLKRDNLINELELNKSIYWRRFLTFILLTVILLTSLIYYMYKKQKRTNKLIQIEKSKSDSLLLNILPIEIAKELKEKGKTTPQSFDNVTVMFSDLVNFTEIVSKLEPETVINELNELFTQFDNIMEKNNCERIKTIGDAYLAVCGMPEANEYHAVNIVKSAIEMLKYLQNRNANKEIKWAIRIGVHTGSVVGGVVGIKKYIYDIFGDTINTTSRIETHSLPMQINISETTYDLVKDDFSFEENSTVDLKGKGELKIYLLAY